MSAIKTVVFDLGNVLFDFDFKKAFGAFSRLQGMTKRPEEVVAFFRASPVERAYTEGKVSTAVFFEHVKDGLGLSCGFDDFRQAYCDIFTANTETFAVVQDLKRQEIKLMVLSNTNELHFDFLAELSPWTTLFDACVLSYQVFCQKPQQEIYDILIERAGCAPAHIFFTDDLEENITAAGTAGIRGYRFDTAGGLRARLHDEGIPV